MRNSIPKPCKNAGTHHRRNQLPILRSDSRANWEYKNIRIRKCTNPKMKTQRMRGGAIGRIQSETLKPQETTLVRKRIKTINRGQTELLDGRIIVEINTKNERRWVCTECKQHFETTKLQKLVSRLTWTHKTHKRGQLECHYCEKTHAGKTFQTSYLQQIHLRSQ